MTSPAISLPPSVLLHRPKPLLRAIYDILGAPLRMLLLPDQASERWGFTSLRAERFAMVLPELTGRVLDIGAGYHELIRIYRRERPSSEAEASVGVDVVDWGCGCTLIERSDRLPFPDAIFDTVCFIACLNHIPERAGALLEAKRVLKPAGRLLVTMIGHLIGAIGHKLWWYSEDKHRDLDDHEEMGLDRNEVLALLGEAGFGRITMRHFCYTISRNLSHKATCAVSRAKSDGMEPRKIRPA